MTQGLKIGLTILLFLGLFLLLIFGNGLAVESRIKIPGLGIIIAIGIPIAIRAIWRSRPIEILQEDAIVESENVEEEE